MTTVTVKIGFHFQKLKEISEKFKNFYQSLYDIPYYLIENYVFEFFSGTKIFRYDPDPQLIGFPDPDP